MPDVVQRLIVEHVPDEPWPCSLRKLAEHARRLQSAGMPHGPDEPSP